MSNVYENLFHQHAYISVYTIHLFRNVDMVKRTFCQPTTVLHFFPFCISFFLKTTALARILSFLFKQHQAYALTFSTKCVPDSG